MQRAAMTRRMFVPVACLTATLIAQDPEPVVLDSNQLLEDWSCWWDLNRDRYLDLRAAVHRGVFSDDIEFPRVRERPSMSLAPTLAQIEVQIVPRLVRLLRQADGGNRDLQASTMIALAKIGVDPRDESLVSLFEDRVRAHDAEVRDAAVLALGIVAGHQPAAIPVLHDLLLEPDSPPRVRSLACYGLGLAAETTTTVNAPDMIARRLAKELLDASLSADERIAAAIGLGMLRRDNEETSAGARDTALRALEQAFARANDAQGQAPVDPKIAAHCATTIARLITRQHSRADHFRRLFAAELKPERRGGRDRLIQQSCALALGQLCRAVETRDPAASPDIEFTKLLHATARTHDDAQTRHFAVLALGQIGGRAHRDLLLDLLHKLDPAGRAWAALSLGVLARELDEPDAGVGEALHTVLANDKDPNVTAAVAISLALAGRRTAGVELRARLGKPLRDEARGHLAIALGLMRDVDAIPELSRMAKTSLRRPALLVAISEARALAGDKQPDLLDMLAATRQNVASFAACANAMARTGDRRMIAPLLRALDDEEISDLQRAFVAVALGDIAARRALPWNAPFGANINYRAETATLINRSSGILDWR